MNKAVAQLAGMGIPALILIVVMGQTGLVGAAAIIAALVAIGPGGIFGGVLTLAAIALVSALVAEVGVDEGFVLVCRRIASRNRWTRGSMIKKVQRLPITRGLKEKIVSRIRRALRK